MNPKLCMILAMALFGSVGLFVRGIDLPSSEIALIRGFLGSLFLLLIVFVFKKPFSWQVIKKNLLIFIISGAAIGFNWIFLFEAYKYTTIANATLSYYFAPVIVVLLSPFVLKEHLSLLKFMCVIAAVCGLFLVVGFDAALSSSLLIGVGYGLLAAALYALVVILNKFIKGVTGMEITLTQLAMASLVLLPYVCFTQGLHLVSMSAQSWLCMLVVGLVHTGLGYYLYFSSMQKLPGQTVASLSYVDPVSAIIMASIFLGETLGFIQIVGAALILSATFVGERYGNKKR